VALLSALASCLVFGLGGYWLRGRVADGLYWAAFDTAFVTATGLSQSFFTAPSSEGVSDLVNGADWVMVLDDGRVFAAAEGLAPYLERGALRLPPTVGTRDVDVDIPAAGLGRYDGRTLHFIGMSTPAPVPGAVLRERRAWLATGGLGWPDRRPAGTTGLPPPSVVSVYVLVSRYDVDRAVAGVDRTLRVGLPVAALLVGMIGWLAASRALRPVEAIRAELADISSRELHRRVPVPPSRDEVHRLAVTMNDLLDRLQRSGDEQDRFVADAAHELRTPIAGMRNELEVAVAHPDAVDLADTVAAALSGAKRLQVLTDDLLTLARTDRTRVAGERAVDLAALVREQVAERAYLDLDGPEFTAAVPDQPITARGDEDALGRLLRNLLDNAARHGTAAVTVGLTSEPGYARIEVLDDGPGIAIGDRERIFGRFTRLDDARSRDRGGIGLGLAIAREIASRHGGTVRVADSERGARFVVRLPLAPDLAVHPTVPA
jgi:signal transduction histidine kinase